MSIYLGDIKISGAGVQVDSALSDTSTRPVENKVVTEALEDVGYNTWTKPADWIDIRSGALGNSVYLLVGHSADYSSYPKFALAARVSTDANTYDVYVDGVKQATTASGSSTTLDWQTLALTSGFDVTTPTNLRAHIVRVTPTVSTDTIIVLTAGNNITGQAANGLLWGHYQLDYPIRIANAFGKEGTTTINNLLQAITAKDNKITYTVNSYQPSSGVYLFAARCSSLVKIPVLVAENKTYASGTYMSFYQVPANVVIKNNKGTESFGVLNNFRGGKMDIENGLLFSNSNAQFTNSSNAYNLKHLPAINTSSTAEVFVASEWRQLQDTFLDDSAGSSRKIFRVNGLSQYPVRGLKGLVVSNEAPFDGASPQINVSYTGLDRAALVNLFNSLPTVSDSQVINITGATGASDLDATDLAIATGKGWTVTR